MKSLLFFLEEKDGHQRLYQILNKGRLNITNPDTDNLSLMYQDYKIQDEEVEYLQSLE